VNGTLVNQGNFDADGTVLLQGPDAVTAGTLTNKGTFVLNGPLTSTAGASGLSALDNQAGATFRSLATLKYNQFTNAGAFSIEAAGASPATTTSCSFHNSGSLTIAAGATLNTTVPYFRVATNSGTIVDRGSFESDHQFENSGTIQNEGTLKAVLDGAAACAFNNVTAGTFTNYGEVSLYCPLTNGGAVTNEGVFNVQMVSSAIFTNDGTFTNDTAGSLYNQNDFTNSGTLVNRGQISNLTGLDSQQGLTNSGTFTLDGSFTNSAPFNIGASGSWAIDVGATATVHLPAVNDGTVDLSGTLTFTTPNGLLQNNGTFRRHCGSVINDTGAAGLQGTAPVNVCP